jgi:toxin ParE1/3/4
VKIRFTKRATENLVEIADYLRERNPAAARRVRGAILESLKILASFPYAGRVQSTERVRKMVTRKYSYLVYYTVDEAADDLIVLSIKHPSREREHDDA